MLLKLYLIIVLTALSSIGVYAQSIDFANKINTKSFDPATLSWYNTLAKKWQQAIPVSNGRLSVFNIFILIK